MTDESGNEPWAGEWWADMYRDYLEDFPEHHLAPEQFAVLAEKRRAEFLVQDDQSDEALDAVKPHTENYWRLAQSGQAHVQHDDPLPDPEGPEGELPYHYDEVSGFSWKVDNVDIQYASWQLAALLFGPDNGSDNRGDIELQMQKVMKMSFDASFRRQNIRTDDVVNNLMGACPRDVLEHFGTIVGMDLSGAWDDEVRHFENRYFDYIVEAYRDRPWPEHPWKRGSFDDAVLNAAGLRAVRQLFGRSQNRKNRQAAS